MLSYQEAVNLLDGKAAAKSSSLEPAELIQLSIAISLKRIADMMKQKMEKEYPYSHGYRYPDDGMPF